MRPVVVLGGYGRLGRLCVHELAGRTQAPLCVAGRSLQRAESLALSFGDRARGVYANAHDPRTLARALEGAGALVACCGGDQLVALQTALELRVPFVGLSPVWPEPRSRAHLAELAWRAQVPVVLAAGALPGLPGILAEALVRQLPEIRLLRIVSTGSYAETETARRDLHRFPTPPAEVSRRDALRRMLPELWRFAEPIGMRPVVPSFSPDLEDFAESHCVETLSYLEPPRGVIGRSIRRLVARAPDAGFGIVATAACDPDPTAPPTAGIELFAQNILIPAAALACALTVAILEGRVPAGLSTPRETLHPALALDELEKRGVRISATSR
jgi:hypothetical protein